VFGDGCGLVLVFESLLEGIVNFRIFPFEEKECMSGEAMAEIVHAGRFFAGLADGSG